MPQLLPEGLRDPVSGQTLESESTTIFYGSTWAMHLGEKCACRKQYPHLDVSGGRVQKLSGLSTLVQWIRLTLTIERFKYPIYDDDFGVEFEALISRSPSPEEVETEAPRMIREALGVDDRVLEVRLVEVRPDDEDPTSYFVDMEVVTFTGDIRSISLSVSLES